jgi:hypothetical protein
MWRVGHEVIREIMLLNHRHDVVFLLEAMGLDVRLELKIRQSFDEGDTL